MPVGMMSRCMSEREFRDWQRYAQKKMLPTRRIELYMAQIALVLSRTVGNSHDAQLSDFLFDLPEAPDVDLKSEIGFAPRK